MKACLFFCFLASLSLASCAKPYYLSVCQRWVDPTYLASFHVSSPDPRTAHPPLGQMLILNWRVPEEVFAEKPEVVLDVILWDYTTRQVRFPMTHRMDVATFRLLGEDYDKTGGILTYKAKVVTEKGESLYEWKHQLYVDLITVTDEKEENL